MSRTTVFYKAKPKGHIEAVASWRSQHSTSQEPFLWSRNSRSKAYLVTLAEIQDASAREVERSHSSRILSFGLIGQHQNKRFHVTEIVLPLVFADAIFRRERSDDRKYVCCSQARQYAKPLDWITNKLNWVLKAIYCTLDFSHTRGLRGETFHVSQKQSCLFIKRDNSVGSKR